MRDKPNPRLEALERRHDRQFIIEIALEVVKSVDPSNELHRLAEQVIHDFLDAASSPQVEMTS